MVGGNFGFFLNQHDCSFDTILSYHKVSERKKTGVLLLCKTLNSRMNIIETRVVSNVVQKNGKYALEAKREGKEIMILIISISIFSASRKA